MKKLFVILGIFCTCSALSQESFTFPKDVKPLIATRWGQWYPFNALAPAVEHDGMKVRPAAGCGAVAMAQIVNFHKYPCYSPDGEYEYKWDLMYHRASNDLRNDQIVSVAKLISDCGVSAFTKYGKEESGSSLRKLMNGLKRLYGYSDYIGIYNRNRYTTAKGDSIFRMMLFKELEAGRPVLYRGYKKGENDGHLFIIDGCKKDKVHVNFGWAGKDDDYYRLDDLNGYADQHWMLVGVADSTFVPAITAIHLDHAGTLKDSLTTQQQSEIQHIQLSGAVNGDDLRILANMSRTGVLSSVNLRDADIETIPDSAFFSRTLLTYFILPSRCIRIGKNAFEGCINLNRVVFPEGLKYICSNAFRNCVSLISPQLPDSLETIGQCAFYQCDGVFHFVIPKHVWKIENSAFSNCQNLLSVSLPASLRLSSSQLVRKCPKLKRYTIDPNNKVFVIEGTELKLKNDLKK